MRSRSANPASGPSRAAGLEQPSTADEWTERAYPRTVFVPQLVAVQAVAHPHGRALVACNEVLTYLELDKSANRIAHYLRSFGVGPDTLVGICLERSVGQVVSALGVLKAGGAYLPMDPAYPAERLTFMLNDAQAPVLLTKQQFAARLPAGKWRVINLDLDEPQICSCPAELSSCSVDGKNLAYVIYTSGSTGKPKGVQITHDSLLNLDLWHQQTFGVKPSDRATQLASPGFDAAVWEVWPYLTAGASVFLPADGVINEPEALRTWLVTQGITITFLPTPLAERMIALKWPSDTALRIVLTGADTLHIYPPSGLPFALINNYGPTECTVVASSGPVFPNTNPNILPPIGRPIDNTQIYILNEDMNQVPIGEPGEIYIGGAGVARGYRNRPDLTAERFVPDPFSTEPGGRLYRTGDLARFLPDGQIAFLGRVDDQIKIRGFRIEPAEIVNVLTEHPAVQASVVLSREVKPGDKRLIAYVVPTTEAKLTHTELRNFAAARLPEYMIPAMFVEMRALPLNPNGKIDRASLPEANAGNILRDENYVEPRTLIERRVATILGELLDIEQVSVEDNFFLLGGHSLLGIQLIARVRKAFAVDLGLRRLFDAPTVSKLSAQIEALLVTKIEALTEDEVRRLLNA